jgi:hypothetical protein
MVSSYLTRDSMVLLMTSERIVASGHPYMFVSMQRFLLASLLALAAVPAVAFAAAKPGTYSGTSSGKYIQVGQAEEPTDRGKVSFTVKSSKVLNFKVRGQLFQCGPPNEIPVTVKTIKLNS